MLTPYVQERKMTGPNPFRTEERVTRKLEELARNHKLRLQLISTEFMCFNTVVTNIYSSDYKTCSLKYTFHYDNQKKTVLGQAYVLMDRGIIISRYHRMYPKDTILNRVDKNLLEIMKSTNSNIYDNVCEDRQVLVDRFLSMT